MKKIFTPIAILFCSLAAMAQTPEEIVNRMEKTLEEHEDEGIIMTIETKMPLVGTIALKTYTLGDKMRSEGKLMGIDVIIFSDGVTEWTYTSKNNKITIEDESPSSDSSEGGDEEMFFGITDDFDVTLSKETADAWYLTCKKSKNCTDPDVPKTMDLVVSKGTYYPKLLKAKISGVSVAMRDVSFGVKEDYVTFRLSDYPGAKVEDNRGKSKK